jgi:hypothetical protein
MATVSAEDIPTPASDVGDAEENVQAEAPTESTTTAEMMNILEKLRTRVAELEQELKGKSKPEDSTHGMLKPIDIKDIDKPEKYDNNIVKFNTWFDKFRDLLANRHPNWRKLLKAIEGRGKNIVKNQAIFFEGLDETDGESVKYIKQQSEMYAEQLKSYLRTYTEG